MKRVIPLVLALLSGPGPAAAQAISLHPENPHYFQFRGSPTVLITSAEHYGAVVNADFDYLRYLDALAADGLNYTRIFSGAYVEPQGAFGIEKNTLAPHGDRLLIPWARSSTAGYAGGGNKFDLSRWDDSYFRRLHDFVAAAGQRGIVVEVTLFSSIYGDAQWAISPLNPANHVDGAALVDRRQVTTLDNGALMAHQERLVRKIVRELNAYDNVIFEIQNEPWADNGFVAAAVNPYLEDWRTEWKNRVEHPTEASLAWQRKIVEIIRSAEADLPVKHLIAQNYTNFAYPIAEVDPAVSVLNFHYAYPEAVALNYGWDRAIGLDETGFAGSADSTYRRQAWRFMLAGGALFNNLDYSFSVQRPDGTDSNRAPGGGSPTLRRQLGVLKRFLDGFDFVRMRPDRDVVVLAPGATREALADPGRAYAVYLEGVLRGDLVLQLPGGRYRATWVDVTTGAELGSEETTHPGGKLRLRPPAYREAVALRVVAR